MSRHVMLGVSHSGKWKAGSKGGAMRAHEPIDFPEDDRVCQGGHGKDTVVVRFRSTGTSRRSLALND
jgi:hypothetical protein